MGQNVIVSSVESSSTRLNLKMEGIVLGTSLRFDVAINRNKDIVITVKNSFPVERNEPSGQTEKFDYLDDIADMFYTLYEEGLLDGCKDKIDSLASEHYIE